MANDKDYRVKKSIASSLGEISKIIGKENTQEDLLGIVEKLYKEEGEIRNIIMKNAPMILRNLENNYKLTYLEKLRRFLNIKEKWRTRFEYAKIIASFNYVFDDDITYKQIFPISLNFCTDDVAEVRFKSAKNCSKIVSQLLNGNLENYKETTFKIMVAFATSINYHFRQQ
jgi:serine/threonine-protein phosphatase 4 regulatory subunit 1